MIIVKSPLRISLGGGGTDLPNYFNKYGGFTVSMAIDKFVTIVINKNLKNRFEIKYSEYEKSKNIVGIKHNIVRECLKLFKVKEGLEISSFSDVPHGTGLGSSGAFTVCLLKGMYEYYNRKISQKKLALLAFKIERKILKQPVGYQDQISSSYGGITKQVYRKNKILITKMKLNKRLKTIISKNFLLVYTGIQRDSKKILYLQEKLTKQNNKNIIENLNKIKQNGRKVYNLIINKNLSGYGKYLTSHWEAKKKLNKKTINRKTNKIINLCLKNGAEGCRIVGAGAGGYVLVYGRKLQKITNRLSYKKIVYTSFNLDNEGARLIYKK